MTELLNSVGVSLLTYVALRIGFQLMATNALQAPPKEPPL